MNSMVRILLIISTFFIGVSCDNIVEPNIPNDIQVFVNNLNLDRPQEIEIIVEVAKDDIYIFKVPYGPPQDCPAGCFYSNFWGLKNKTKLDDIELYNIDSTDTLLFNFDFFELVKNTNEWVYYSKFLPLLASEEDTPLYVLVKIANILNDYINTHIVYKLLDNPVVQNDVGILTILSQLPIYQGDPYKNIRQIANNFLGNLTNT